MKISVVIPVKNGGATLDRCLSSIRAQTLQDIEIIIFDSMSTDDSREIALKYKVSMKEIPEGSFNHGLTRNLGVEQAQGDLIFFTVQDAWLEDNDALEKMAAHFENKAVMGVVGHQAVPHELDKNPLLWFKRFSEPTPTYRRVNDWEEFTQLPDAVQQALIAWDNVVAMYRRAALLKQPFVATEFAEDCIWCRDALMKGWLLVHDPSIVIYHYHHQSYQYAYKVAYAVNYHFYKFFEIEPRLPPLLKFTAEATWHLGKHPALGFKQKMHWIFHNYSSRLGSFNSHINFLWHLKTGGEDAIEKRYRKVCKVIPQGKQKESR